MKKTATLILASLALCTTKAMAQTEVTFYTTMGNFTVELTDTKTPITVDSFLARTSDKFYDGVIFHRVIDGFMIQGGDPTGTGTGGPGYTIPDEFDPTLSNVQGTISMANTGAANSGGSQFFINLVNNTYLDYNKAPTSSKHAVFGTVTTNFSVVQAIGKVPVNSSNKPTTDVVMDSIRITKFPTSIRNTTKLTDVANLYPNPTNGQFSISLTGSETIKSVTVLNLAGQVIWQANTTDQKHISIDIANQPKGLYLINMEGTEETYSGRVFLQ